MAANPVYGRLRREQPFKRRKEAQRSAARGGSDPNSGNLLRFITPFVVETNDEIRNLLRDPSSVRAAEQGHFGGGIRFRLSPFAGLPGEPKRLP